MDYQLNTRLNGNIAMTSRFHENKPLQRDKTLYKFLWVQSGTLAIEVDHIPMKLAKDEIVTLTPLHHLTIKEVAGELNLPMRKLKAYVLTNFNTTFEEDLFRIYALRDIGVDPYVMIYDKRNAPKQIRHLQRWCNNKRIFSTEKNFFNYKY